MRIKNNAEANRNTEVKTKIKTKTSVKAARILSLLLMVCMVVTLMPTMPAYAATSLNNHTVNLTMPTPNAGGHPCSSENITVTGDDAERVRVSKVTWNKGEWGAKEEIESEETFREGNTYSVEIAVSTEDGYVFDETTKFTVNGQAIEVDRIWHSNRYAYIIPQFTIGSSKPHEVNVELLYRDSNGEAKSYKKVIESVKAGQTVTASIPFTEVPADCTFDEWVTDKPSSASYSVTNIDISKARIEAQSDGFHVVFTMPGKDAYITAKLKRPVKSESVNIKVKGFQKGKKYREVSYEVDVNDLEINDSLYDGSYWDFVDKYGLFRIKDFTIRDIIGEIGDDGDVYKLQLYLYPVDGYYIPDTYKGATVTVNGISDRVSVTTGGEKKWLGVGPVPFVLEDSKLLEKVSITGPVTMYSGTEYQVKVDNLNKIDGVEYDYTWYSKESSGTGGTSTNLLGDGETLNYTPKGSKEVTIEVVVKAKSAAMNDGDTENCVIKATKTFTITPIDRAPQIVSQPTSLTNVTEDSMISFTAKATKATSATWYEVYPSGTTYVIKDNPNPAVATSTSFDNATGTATLTRKATRGGSSLKHFVVFEGEYGNVSSEKVDYKFNFVPVTGIDGVADTTTIPVGGYLYLPEEASPATATNKDITCEVTNGSEFVKVYGNNSFRGIKPGSVTIKATVKDGLGTGKDFTKEYKVTVKPAVTLGVLQTSYTSDAGKGQKIEWTLTKDENSPLTYYTHLYKKTGTSGTDAAWTRVATNLKSPYTVPFDAAESGKTCTYKLSAKASSGDFEVVEKEFEITWTAPTGDFKTQPKGGVGIRGTEDPDEQGFDVTFAVTEAVNSIEVKDKDGWSASLFDGETFPTTIPAEEEQTIRINSKRAGKYTAEETFYIEATLNDGSTTIQSLPFVVKWADSTTKYGISVDPNGGGGSMTISDKVQDGTYYELPDCTITPPNKAIFAGWRVNGELKFDDDLMQSVPSMPGEKAWIDKNTTLTPVWQYDIADITVTGLDVPVKGAKPDFEATVESVSGGNQVALGDITWIDTANLAQGYSSSNIGDKTFEENHTYYATIPVNVIEPSGFLCDKDKNYIGTTDVKNYDIKEVNGIGVWGKPISSALIYTEPVTVTADVPVVLTVTYDVKGHGTAPDKVGNVNVGDKISAPTPAPTAEGYKLMGWYKDSACTMPWDFEEDRVYKDITLYAKWEAESSSSGDSGSGSGGGSPSTGGGGGAGGGTTEAAPETVTKPDGTTVTTEKKADGTEVITEKKPDGTETVIEKAPDGATKTTETAKDGTKVVTDTDKDGKTTAEVTLPDGKDKADVAIPAPLGDKDGTVTVKVTDKKTGEVKEVKSDYSGGKVSVSVEGDSIIEILDDFVPLAGKMPFVDVKEGDWFYKNVEYVYFNNLMVGTSDTTFSPNAPTTRGMIVTILHRLENTPAPTGENTFKDVENGKWYTDAVTWAKENGIVSGYSENSFGPNDQITREQMAVIMYNYAKLKGSDITIKGDLSKFSDASSVSGWAKEAMTWAVENGIFNGIGDNLLSPGSNATRAQVAAIMDRYLNK